eukprot:CAMPEP_0206462608 /NCGR_PEP_ID=MMETSP0324_2-20121206/26081_1 /ASSEMBLY_ACC=CAM_ASM_000836 /TAXON_ID=2866 /ORGANISM="Crypthecodinium cohnii, Strain Seligo" /LENGTH=854 /DNA_ID=CAMNT_0053934799 /DNA_START=139 /DNA_END=2704 /DNA_ORIENTATION=-
MTNFRVMDSPALLGQELLSTVVSNVSSKFADLSSKASAHQAPFNVADFYLVALAGFAYLVRRQRVKQLLEKKSQEESLKRKNVGPSKEEAAFTLVRSVGEECQADQELRGLLKMKKNSWTVYDGFEPSGRMHIAQGIFKAINVNKCTAAGGTFVFWVADWFALMNDKMGGDLQKIKTVGHYLIEVWRATGMDMSKVKFLWSSDQITEHAEDYWGQAMDIARKSTLARIKKCCQIMGRKEDALTAAQIMYPIMQATDIFFLKADVCQLGVDQRKVNMLARDYCDLVGRRKPVVLSHHMLYGLKAGQAKMSKSDPDSAIFMEDTPEDVERKIRNAYCPFTPEDSIVHQAHAEEMHLVKDELMNPCFDYLRYILFSRPGYVFRVGAKSYSSFEEVKEACLDGLITEDQLKGRLIEEINSLLDPVRKHFAEDPTAKQLLDQIREWKKESMTAPAGVTRAQVDFDRVPYIVFAPFAQETLRISDVLDVLRLLKASPDDHQAVLYLPDWTALAKGCLESNKTAISEYYKFFLLALVRVGGEVMAGVKVLWQTEVILTSPSEYWISVINAGRKCNLEQIRQALPEEEHLDHASQVLALLMQAGDVLALCGGHKNHTLSAKIACSEGSKGSFELASTLFSTLFGEEREAPKILAKNFTSLQLKHTVRGSHDEAHLLLADCPEIVQKKLQKAFCDPKNTTFCPPLALAEALWEVEPGLHVVRPATYGKEQHYDSLAEIHTDFASGHLHPADLKAALASKIANMTVAFRADRDSAMALWAEADGLQTLDHRPPLLSTKDESSTQPLSSESRACLLPLNPPLVCSDVAGEGLPEAFSTARPSLAVATLFVEKHVSLQISSPRDPI